MLESDNDRLGYLKAFGVNVEAERGTLLGIFDAQYVDANGVDETGPVLECRSSDVKRLELGKGSSLSIDGEVYTVRRPEPDGTGMTRLILGR
jgi:hypothetical protein